MEANQARELNRRNRRVIPNAQDDTISMEQRVAQLKAAIKLAKKRPPNGERSRWKLLAEHFPKQMVDRTTPTHPIIKLNNMQISGIDLSEFDLRNCQLSDTTLQGILMNQALLQEGYIRGTVFDAVSMIDTDIEPYVPTVVPMQQPSRPPRFINTGLVDLTARAQKVVIGLMAAFYEAAVGSENNDAEKKQTPWRSPGKWRNATREIFGVNGSFPITQVVSTLLTRADKNPGGASSKTKKAMGISEAMLISHPRVTNAERRTQYRDHIPAEAELTGSELRRKLDTEVDGVREFSKYAFLDDESGLKFAEALRGQTFENVTFNSPTFCGYLVGLDFSHETCQVYRPVFIDAVMDRDVLNILKSKPKSNANDQPISFDTVQFQGKFIGADFLDAAGKPLNLGKCTFARAILKGVEFCKGHCLPEENQFASFEDASLDKVTYDSLYKLGVRNFSGAFFDGEDLTGSNFTGATFSHARFRGCKLNKIQGFNEATIDGAMFNSETEFNGTTITRECFNIINNSISSVPFYGAILSNQFRGGALKGANIMGCNLANANVTLGGPNAVLAATIDSHVYKQFASSEYFNHRNFDATTFKGSFDPSVSFQGKSLLGADFDEAELRPVDPSLDERFAGALVDQQTFFSLCGDQNSALPLASFRKVRFSGEFLNDGDDHRKNFKNKWLLGADFSAAMFAVETRSNDRYFSGSHFDVSAFSSVRGCEFSIFSEIYLSGDLAGLSFEGATLYGVKFDADAVGLQSTAFKKSNIDAASYHAICSKVSKVDSKSFKLEDLDFVGNCENLRLENVVLRNVRFSQCTTIPRKFSDVVMDRDTFLSLKSMGKEDFSGVTLTGEFTDDDFIKTDLTNTQYDHQFSCSNLLFSQNISNVLHRVIINENFYAVLKSAGLVMRNTGDLSQDGPLAGAEFKLQVANKNLDSHDLRGIYFSMLETENWVGSECLSGAIVDYGVYQQFYRANMRNFRSCHLYGAYALSEFCGTDLRDANIKDITISSYALPQDKNDNLGIIVDKKSLKVFLDKGVTKLDRFVLVGNFNEIKFSGKDLTGANIVDVEGANLDLQGATIDPAIFTSLKGKGRQDFSGVKLVGNFSRENFSGIILDKVAIQALLEREEAENDSEFKLDLSGAILTGDMEGISFDRVNLVGVTLLDSCLLSGDQIQGARIDQGVYNALYLSSKQVDTFKNIQFSGDFSSASFADVHLENADFSRTMGMSSSDGKIFDRTSLDVTSYCSLFQDAAIRDFTRVCLRGAFGVFSFVDVTLVGVRFSHDFSFEEDSAVLPSVVDGATLDLRAFKVLRRQGITNFSGAKFSGGFKDVSFEGCNLSDASFQSATLDQSCSLSQCTLNANVLLSLKEKGVAEFRKPRFVGSYAENQYSGIFSGVTLRDATFEEAITNNWSFKNACLDVSTLVNMRVNSVAHQPQALVQDEASNQPESLKLRGVLEGTILIGSVGPEREDTVNLSYIDFSSCKFLGIDLRRANLTGAFFKDIKVENSEDLVIDATTQLDCATFQGETIFAFAYQKGIRDFSSCGLIDLDLSPDSDFSEIILRDAELYRVAMLGVKLTSAVLENATFQDCYLQKSGQQCSDLTGANLTGATFPGTNLREIIIDLDLASTNNLIPDGTFCNAKISLSLAQGLYQKNHRNFSGVDLSSAKTQTAIDLSGIHLVNAVLAGMTFNHEVKLDGAKLEGAKFTGSILSVSLNGVTFNEETDLTKVKWRVCVGLKKGDPEIEKLSEASKESLTKAIKTAYLQVPGWFTGPWKRYTLFSHKQGPDETMGRVINQANYNQSGRSASIVGTVFHPQIFDQEAEGASQNSSINPVVTENSKR